MTGIETYKFYLNFIGSFGMMEITETVKFDGATFILKQDDKRYGRDVSFMNESIDLFFYKGFYDKTTNNLALPDGTIVNHLSHGFEQLLDARNNTGFESEVEYILEKENITFVTGVLDFQKSESDELTYLSCKIVQNTNRQIVKRREDLVVDIFSNEGIDGNDIVPLATDNILLKAKPITQVSEWAFLGDFWTETGVFSSGNLYVPYVNPISNIKQSDIDSTITGFYQKAIFSFGASDNFEKVYDLGCVIAQDDLTSSEITLTDVKFSLYIPTGANFEDGWNNTDQSITFSSFEFVNDEPSTITNTNAFQLWRNPNTNTNPNVLNYELEFLGNASVDHFQGYSGNADRYQITIPEITIIAEPTARGNRLSFAFSIERYVGTNIIEWQSGSIRMKSTATAIDTVIKGVRYIDVLKQTSKSISGLDVYAPRFDVGGEYYDQFVFTGNLIKGRDDVPFPVKFKDAFATIKEVNCDYQILEDNIYIGSYADFYPNHEIGVFASYPDVSFKSYFNDRYAINNFEFKYKNFEQDRDEQNTIDAIHTESQWTILNKQVENSKKIELEQIRDAFKIEVSKKEAVNKTTSVTDDDKLFLIDIIPLSPTAEGGFTASMTHNVNDDGDLQLLKDADLPSWSLLGFGIGDDFTVVNTDNAGDYTVLDITDNIITLTGGTPTFNGEALTEVSYFFTNVQYTNRTNEGFDLIENIQNGDKFSNLKYSIKRNIITWHPYLATANRYANRELRNTYFKSNGNAITRFIGEENNTKENANVEDLGDGILTCLEYHVKLVANLNSVVNLLNALNTINEDDTIGGFIRIVDVNDRVLKLYIKKLEYEPASETLTITGEQRNEGDLLKINSTTVAGAISINEAGYSFEILSNEWFEMNNDFLLIHDGNDVPIINPTRYDKVEVDGEIYVTRQELIQRLIDITE